MPSPYLKAEAKHLSPEEMEKALGRYRKALASGVPVKHLLQSGRFRSVPHEALVRVSSEVRRHKAKHQAVQTASPDNTHNSSRNHT